MILSALFLAPLFLPLDTGFLAAGGRTERLHGVLQDPTDARSHLNRIRDLNRSGRWDEAAQQAQALAGQSDQTGLVRAEALVSLAYSRVRLGQGDSALEALTAFEELAKELPEQHWIRREVARLREELAGKPEIVRDPRRERPEDDYWQVVDPRQQGLDPNVLEAYESHLKDSAADAGLIVHRGRIVSEYYGPHYRYPAHAMSSTKSITALLVGMLLEDRRLSDLDAPVADYLPSWSKGQKAEVRLRQLLNHTSGLFAPKGESVGFVSDKNDYVVRLPLQHVPGARFHYSNEAVQLLSPILDRAAGRPIQDYARERLFEPLGMRNTRMKLDSRGHAWTYADMETTPRDLARIGMLMLQDGKWGQEQVIAPSWIESITKASQPYRKDCGLLWWLHERPRGFAAHGYLDTNLYVFPDLELIVVRTQAKPVEGAKDFEPRALKLLQALVRQD